MRIYYKNIKLILIVEDSAAIRWLESQGSIDIKVDRHNRKINLPEAYPGNLELELVHWCRRIAVYTLYATLPVLLS